MLLRTFAIGLTVFAAAVATTTGRRPAAAPVTLLLGVDRPGASIAKTMVGVFFEDINFAADGGLYPERVKNRSFEFPDPLMGWKRATPCSRHVHRAHRDARQCEEPALPAGSRVPTARSRSES